MNVQQCHVPFFPSVFLKINRGFLILKKIAAVIILSNALHHVYHCLENFGSISCFYLNNLSLGKNLSKVKQPPTPLHLFNLYLILRVQVINNLP